MATRSERCWNWLVVDHRTLYILDSVLIRDGVPVSVASVISRATAASTHGPRKISVAELRFPEGRIGAVWPGDITQARYVGRPAGANGNLLQHLQRQLNEPVTALRRLQGISLGQRYLNGWVLTYNLFREQEPLRARTPANAAKLDPPFCSWEAVVERKARVRTVLPTCGDRPVQPPLVVMGPVPRGA